MHIFDGIVACPCIRGGGANGKSWHDAALLFKRQNAFNDFQVAAEYLVREKYTEHRKIVIHGHSNGGLLVAACINQRPDLFGAAIDSAGLTDMLRIRITNPDVGWEEEFGSPDVDKEFRNLLKYSPIHNVHVPTSETDQYPATLIVQGDEDDTVLPLHSLKFAAALQNAAHNNAHQKNPILFKMNENSDHGDGDPNQMSIQTANMLSFIYQALKLEHYTL